MSSRFEKLKNSRSDRLANFKSQNSKKSYKDDRFWSPELDKAGNGSFLIRFLPAPEGETVDIVEIFSHSFKGSTGRWYIEKSLSTIGKPDPLGEYNAKLWNSTTDDKSPQRAQVRDQKRKVKYYTNIQVLRDPVHPENNGKVFLYAAPKRINDKIDGALNPPEVSDDPIIDPFSMTESGANFNLIIKTVDGYPNYNDSKFSFPKPISENEDEILAIWDKCYSLQEFLKPENFKTYDELKTHLWEVLGIHEDEPHPEPKEKPSRRQESYDDSYQTSSDSESVPAMYSSLSSKLSSNSDNDDDDDIPF